MYDTSRNTGIIKIQKYLQGYKYDGYRCNWRARVNIGKETQHTNNQHKIVLFFFYISLTFLHNNNQNYKRKHKQKINNTGQGITLYIKKRSRQHIKNITNQPNNNTHWPKQYDINTTRLHEHLLTMDYLKTPEKSHGTNKIRKIQVRKNTIQIAQRKKHKIIQTTQTQQKQTRHRKLCKKSKDEVKHTNTNTKTDRPIKRTT